MGLKFDISYETRKVLEQHIKQINKCGPNTHVVFEFTIDYWVVLKKYYAMAFLVKCQVLMEKEGTPFVNKSVYGKALYMFRNSKINSGQNTDMPKIERVSNDY